MFGGWGKAGVYAAAAVRATKKSLARPILVKVPRGVQLPADGPTDGREQVNHVEPLLAQALLKMRRDNVRNAAVEDGVAKQLGSNAGAAADVIERGLKNRRVGIEIRHAVEGNLATP